MNRRAILFYLVVLCSLIKGYGQGLPQRKMVVVIDPGHGGTDPGAIGMDGIREKDITLRMAKQLVRYYRKTEDDKLEIYLTRYSDTLILLKDRVRLARTLKADLFLSIHCNWAANASVQGVEAFVPYPETGSYVNIRTSIALALNLVMGFEKQLERKNRGVKFANFQVLREAILQCPSVLLEVGFISNKNELYQLQNIDYTKILIHNFLLQ